MSKELEFTRQLLVGFFFLSTRHVTLRIGEMRRGYAMIIKLEES